MTSKTIPQLGESGNTPGPWAASAPDASYHDVIRIYSESDITVPVAVCPQRQSAVMSVLAGRTDATTEAACNARLIAASPELLAALERVVAAMEREIYSEVPVTSIGLEHTLMVEAAEARAVIMAARGESYD